jgi:hypothetical protein
MTCEKIGQWGPKPSIIETFIPELGASPMDKESLIKNQFWLGLGGFGLLWLILWICALTNGSAEADKEKSDYGKVGKDIDGWKSKTPKNAKFIAPWQEYGKKFSDLKNKVWGDAWDTQKDFYVWAPKDWSNTDFNRRMLYAADTKDMTIAEREDYKRVYQKQFEQKNQFDDPPLTDLVQPAYFLGNEAGFRTIMGPETGSGGAAGGPGAPGGPKMGAMGMDGGGGKGGPGGSSQGFDQVLNKELSAPPTPEEIWLLQEDFWVKHELLNVIRKVQQGAGRFKPVVEVKEPPASLPLLGGAIVLGLPKPPPPPKAEPIPEGLQDAVVRRFSNGVWEFTLYIVTKGNKPAISAKSTIKNVSANRNILPLSAARGTKGLEFYLTQQVRVPLPKVEGEFLAWYDGSEGRKDSYTPWKQDISFDNLDLTKDFGLEQSFDWSNAPVRRIDMLRTAQQSHRTAKGPLVPHPIFKETAAPGTGAPVTPGPGPNGPAIIGGNPPPGGPRPGPMGGAPTGPSDTTPYGLNRNRYIQGSTEQARHLPFAMVLIVEPAHINDVLIALADSPLRIQTTQMSFQKLARVAPPETTTTTDKAPMGGMKGNKPAITPSRGGEGAASGTQQATDDDNGDTSLFELTIYGIATLYERPKKIEAATPAGPAVPTPPAGPATPPPPPPTKGK